MSLKHQLRITSLGIPELHASVLGTREDPSTVRAERNTKHKVLVTLEDLDALAATRLVVSTVAVVVGLEFPHADRPVQTTGHKFLAGRRERNRVDTIFVAGVASSLFQAFEKITSAQIPNADTLVQATSGEEAVVGRNGNRSDTVFYGKSQDALAAVDVPEAHSAVTRSRSNVAAVRRVVKRVNVLLVTAKGMTNDALLDIPDLEVISKMER